jgi:predicted RND superfamily exporter protein
LFGGKNQFVVDAKHSTENLGSLYSYEVLIELPDAEMAKEPKVLFALEKLDSLINTFSTTKFTSSINDLIKDINQTMHKGNVLFFKIPESRKLIAQYLLLYEMAGGEELENCVDYEYQQLRHSVRINRSTTDLKYDFEKIKKYSKEIFPKGTKVSIVGDMSVFLRAVSFLVNGQIISILIAFIGILIVLIFTLKSFKLALIAMIPNVFPVFVLTGIMGALGITLNLQTIVAAPVIMGLAVDDTVHYFLHLKEEFRKHKSYRIANKEAFIKVGWALINTSLILLVGFLSFLFTCVDSLQSISILLLAGVVSALLADLLISPVLFVLFNPFGKEDKTDNDNVITAKKSEKIKKLLETANI